MPAFGAVLVCDDVRRDTNNKDIIIGVYAADIRIGSTPNWLPVAVYLEYLPSEVGEQEIELRLGIASAGLVGANIKLRVDELMPVAIPVLGLQIFITQEEDLIIEASFDAKKTWQELKRKPIRVGPLLPPVPLPAPTPISGPSGNL